MCGVQLAYRKTAKDLMLMFGLYDTMDKLVMANSVHLCVNHVLMSEYAHLSRMELDFEVEGHRKKRRPKLSWMK